MFLHQIHFKIVFGKVHFRRDMLSQLKMLDGHQCDSRLLKRDWTARLLKRDWTVRLPKCDVSVLLFN